MATLESSGRVAPSLRPAVQARGASLHCPSTSAIGTFRPDPGSLPQDHPGRGGVAPWHPPGQLHCISIRVCLCKG